MTGVVAGALIETARGAEPRVAARLARVAGLTLEAGDGDRRLAVTLEAADAAALEALTRALVEGDEEILGVYPTFFASDDDAPPG